MKTEYKTIEELKKEFQEDFKKRAVKTEYGWFLPNKDFPMIGQIFFEDKDNKEDHENKTI